MGVVRRLLSAVPPLAWCRVCCVFVLVNLQRVVLGWLEWCAPSVGVVWGMVLVCKCFGGSEVVQVRIWTFQATGSVKCVVLHGVGQPGNDAISVMLLVTQFPTISPWVLWGGRPHSHAVLVLLLVALVLVIFHHGIPVLVVDPLRGPVLVLALVALRCGQWGEQKSAVGLDVAGNEFGLSSVTCRGAGASALTVRCWIGQRFS